jgi:hypothetical protein
MRYYLDTEFNEFGGALISMALVPATHTFEHFYEEVIFHNPGPWVKENVVPKLTKTPIDRGQFQSKLYGFLLRAIEADGIPTIIADYPDDLSYFVKALITGPGMRININEIDFKLRCGLTYTSKVPHNAYEDAIGLRNSGEGISE